MNGLLQLLLFPAVFGGFCLYEEPEEEEEFCEEVQDIIKRMMED